MRHTFRNLLLIAVTVAAIAPSAANAATSQSGTCGIDYSRNSVDGHYCVPTTGSAQAAAVASTCGMDYSRNSVDGHYCVSSVSSPIVAAVPRSAPVAVATSHSFSWGNAAAGAGGALLLVAAAAGLTLVVRRRQDPPAGQQHSPAAG
jgi:hypothetical protein